VAQLSAEVVVALGVFVAQALAEHEVTCDVPTC
jgi:hypothetical protein